MTKEEREELKHHQCSMDDKWPLHDGRGIFCCYVCDLCEEVKSSQYRPEVMNSWYDAGDVDEPIEADEYY